MHPYLCIYTRPKQAIEPTQINPSTARTLIPDATRQAAKQPFLVTGYTDRY